MHELSIAHGIVDAVQEHLRRARPGAPPARVTRVFVDIGALSGVVPGALAFCFDVATAGTALDGAALDVATVPVAVWCAPCAAERALPEATRFRCPTCGTPSADVRRGRELDVRAYELEDDADVAASVPPPVSDHPESA